MTTVQASHEVKRQSLLSAIGQRAFGSRRCILVGCGDPPDPDQSGFAGTIYMVQVCKRHDPDPRRSLPMPRPPGSGPIGERPRR
jgi:hypothetical protein